MLFIEPSLVQTLAAIGKAGVVEAHSVSLGYHVVLRSDQQEHVVSIDKIPRLFATIEEVRDFASATGLDSFFVTSWPREDAGSATRHLVSCQ